MAKQWKINELETGLTPVTLSYVDDNGDTRARTFSADELHYSLRRYNAWTFIDYTGSLKANVLVTNWVKWLAINKDRFDRIFRAFDERYNPLENYLKHGHIETQYGHKIDNTAEFDKSNTETTTHGHKISSDTDYGARNIETMPNELVTTTKERSADGSVMGAVNEVVSSATQGKGGTTKESSRSDEHSETHSGTDNIALSESGNNTNTEQHSGVDVVEDTTHGNIGVTRADEMALGEYKLRQLVLCDEIIDAFVYDNAYFCLDDIF